MSQADSASAAARAIATVLLIGTPSMDKTAYVIAEHALK
jgi:hypothetical protein